MGGAVRTPQTLGGGEGGRPEGVHRPPTPGPAEMPRPETRKLGGPEGENQGALAVLQPVGAGLPPGCRNCRENLLGSVQTKKKSQGTTVLRYEAKSAEKGLALEVGSFQV